MSPIEQLFDDRPKTCPVCEIPLESLPNTVKYQYLTKSFAFCSNKCLKDYLEDPEKYTAYEDDEEAE